MPIRTSAEIQAEIETRFGFFPPFFAPAVATPGVLESLWQQTLTAYVDSPVPALFKEKLAASIARFCTVPYCLLCHSSTLRPLGMKASEVLALLQEEPPDQLSLAFQTRQLDSEKLTGWPAPGSEIENGIYSCCVAIFLNQETEYCQAKLRQILPNDLYDYLILFLTYNRTCIAWAEAHPELDYQSDRRVQDHYAAMTKEDPRLADFFENYRSRAGEQKARREQWLSQENKFLLDELRHSQEWLAATLHGIGDAVIATDVAADPRVTFLNGVAEDLTGWSLADAKGRPAVEIFNIIHSKSRKQAVSPIGTVIETGKIQGLANHTILISKQGREYVIEDSAAPIRNAGGEISGVVLIFRDVTEQKRRELETNEANRQIEMERAKLRVMILESPAAMALFHGPAFVFELVNQRWIELVGPREYLGKTYLDVYPELRETALPRILRDVYETGVTFAADEMLVPVLGPSGKIEDRYYDFTYVRIDAAEDEHRGIFCHATNVTEKVRSRKVLEESQSSLRLSEERLSATIDVSKVGFYEWDIESNKVIFSPQMQQDWGIEAGVSLQEILLRIDSRDRDEVYRLISETLSSRQSFRAEYRVLRAGGDVAWIEARGKVDQNEFGKPVRFFGTSVDVTDRVLGRQQLELAKTIAEEANQVKSAFLANMSHEIRTPLGAILGFTDLLKGARLTGEERDYLDVISRSGMALSHVIDDILDLSKVEAGQLKVEVLPFDLRNLAKDVVFLFSDTARSKELSLKFESDIPLDLLVLSDPVRVRQILVNLIGNALKFTAQGEVKISLGVVSIDAVAPRFEIRVSDTGRGIDDDQAKKLFQPFVQADDSTTRMYGGTGLGLALSRRLANALGGNVEIETSAPGRGSTFLFSFNSQVAKKSEHEEVVAARPRLSEKKKALLNCSVLVVDDSPDNRVLMKVLLRRAGAKVDEASSGEEAIAKALSGEYDIVLMDIQMPGMDGYETLAALKRERYGQPVIALTAHAMVEEKRRTLAAGFADHVTKPVDPETLVVAILRSISRG